MIMNITIIFFVLYCSKMNKVILNCYRVQTRAVLSMFRQRSGNERCRATASSNLMCHRRCEHVLDKNATPAWKLYRFFDKKKKLIQNQLM